MIKMVLCIVASIFILRFGSIGSPPLFYERVRFYPTTRDSALWKLDEECLGKKASMKHVKFYYLPSKKAEVWDEEDGAWIRAYVWWPDSSINLLQRFRADSQIERHEMIHMIAHDVDHDSTLFVDKCHIPILDSRRF